MANIITLIRFPVLFIFVGLLYSGSLLGRLMGVPLCLLLILLDTVDGLVARARRETSLLGSVLDIAADRAVELVLWVCFADLKLIPLAIPLIVIVRGTVVDAMRGIGTSQGQTPFGQMQSSWGKWLVASPVMRSGYGISKALAFCTLTLELALGSLPAGSLTVNWTPLVRLVGLALSWLAVILCLVRGMPVLIEVAPLFRSPPRLGGND